MNLKIKDELVWAEYKKNNQDDGYGLGILRFVERWGLMMQAAIESSSDKTPEQVIEEQANALMREADSEGITGFMYGAAVKVLYDCWLYGDQLVALTVGVARLQDPDLVKLRWQAFTKALAVAVQHRVTELVAESVLFLLRKVHILEAWIIRRNFTGREQAHELA